ncbi:MAG TPA: ABC transporter permease subunit [Pseudobdellovibrionaceae bacterium]|jgi:Cu-processing system permease protein
MSKSLQKILKYEFLNIFRDRWIFVYTAIVAVTIFSVQKICGEFQKTVLTLSSLSVVFVPLITSFFTTLYWYYSDRFTQLMATQPVKRSHIFLARYGALTFSLSACYVVGTVLGAALSGSFSLGLVVLIAMNVLLTFIFIALSMLISAQVEDRMRGVGLVFGLWLYFVLIHDGLLLLGLVALREYPMDILGGVLGSLSPIGLSRVVLLMFNEGSLLLGHTGALVREIMTSWQGYLMAIGISVVWAIVPLLFGVRSFKKKDF